jgi:hypothetical protein
MSRSRKRRDDAEWNRLKDIGRGNVERHADWAEDASTDEIHDAVYELAVDKIIDSGCDPELARAVAKELAMEFAQP